MDNDLETAAGVRFPEDEENTVSENDNESDDDGEIVEPTFADMEAAFRTIHNYSATNNVSESFIESLNHIKRNYFLKKRRARLCQKEITDYFVK